MKRQYGMIAARAAVLVLASCTQPLTQTQLQAAEAGITVIDASVPNAAQALAAGQLLCQTGAFIKAIYEGQTGKPFLVTGRTAQTVANVCQLLGAGAVPVAPPTVPTQVQSALINTGV